MCHRTLDDVHNLCHSRDPSRRNRVAGNDENGENDVNDEIDERRGANKEVVVSAVGDTDRHDKIEIGDGLDEGLSHRNFLVVVGMDVVAGGNCRMDCVERESGHTDSARNSFAALKVRRMTWPRATIWRGMY